MKTSRTSYINYIFLLLSVIVLSLVNSFASYAGDDIYLAGAPNQWPFEYYDKATNDYHGIIPDMLRMAGEKAGISIIYIDPSAADNRLSMASDVQVDAICTVGLEERELRESALISTAELLSFDLDGEMVCVSLAYTQSMPDNIRQSLEQSLTTIETAQLHGLYVRYAGEKARQTRHITVYQLTLGVCLFIIILLFLIMYRKAKKKNNQIRRLAYVDEITGQPNMSAFRDKYKKCVVAENREQYALLFLSAGIDNINQIYGYDEAGRALKIINDTCIPFLHQDREGFCRFHEFNFVFLFQYSNEDNMKDRIRQIHEAILKAFVLAKKSYFLDLYTGVYHLRQIDQDMSKAIQYSEAAAEYAQMQHQDIVVYDEYVERTAISGYATEHEAVHGLIRQEFIMYLQPILNLNTGTIAAAEALVRWNNPKRGLLQPNEFLKVMKRKQLLGQMNMEIYRQGCLFLKEMNEKGHSLHMIFNFTAENIREEQFVEQLISYVKQNSLDANYITIQLNQVAEIVRVNRFKETMKALRENGFNICLAGLEIDSVFYEYLEYGVDTIKLRRELVQKLEHPTGYKLMESILTLCRNLELKTVGVGVETEMQAKLLQELGCGFASGHYFYYPLNQKTFFEAFQK